jgi:hypothetical protein
LPDWFPVKRILPLALLAVLVLPGLFGLFAAEHAPRVLAASLGGQGAVPLGHAELERGWFTSNVEQRFRLEDSGLARLLALATGTGAARELIVSATVRHGPLPGLIPALARADTVYRVVDEHGAVLDAPAASRSRVTLTGRVITDIRLDPVVNRCRPDRGCLDSGGGHLRVEQAARGTPWSLSGTLEPLSLSGADGRLTLDALTIRADARAGAGGPRSGQGMISAGPVTVSAPDGRAVTLEFIEVASTLDVAEGRLSQTLRFDAPRIVANDGETAGLRLVLGIRDMDAATIYRLGRELADSPADARPARAARLLTGAWDELAVHGPTLVIEELKLENGADTASGSMQLGLPPATERSGRGLFGTLYQDLDGRLDLALSEGIIRDLSESDPDQGHRMAALISLGYLELREGVYRMQAEYAGRELTVNGRRLSLPALPAP